MFSTDTSVFKDSKLNEKKFIIAITMENPRKMDALPLPLLELF